MSLPENWDRELEKLIRGCNEEEKGMIYGRLIVMFGWKGMLDLKRRGKLTPEATAKFMRSMDEEDARRAEEKLESKRELTRKLVAFKENTLEMGPPADAWSQEVLKQIG